MLKVISWISTSFRLTVSLRSIMVSSRLLWDGPTGISGSLNSGSAFLGSSLFLGSVLSSTATAVTTASDLLVLAVVEWCLPSPCWPFWLTSKLLSDEMASTWTTDSLPRLVPEFSILLSSDTTLAWITIGSSEVLELLFLLLDELSFSSPPSLPACRSAAIGCFKWLSSLFAFLLLLVSEPHDCSLLFCLVPSSELDNVVPDIARGSSTLWPLFLGVGLGWAFCTLPLLPEGVSLSTHGLSDWSSVAPLPSVESTVPVLCLLAKTGSQASFFSIAGASPLGLGTGVLADTGLDSRVGSDLTFGGSGAFLFVDCWESFSAFSFTSVTLGGLGGPVNCCLEFFSLHLSLLEVVPFSNTLLVAETFGVSTPLPAVVALVFSAAFFC